MIEIKRILCPIDFSDQSRLALDYAVAIARWYRAGMTVAHVAAGPPMVYGDAAVVIEPSALSPDGRQRLWEELRGFTGLERAPGINIDLLLLEGNPALEITSQAAAMEADLLVLGTHGRSGFERLVLGSVAEKVLRKVRCPVLTVPPGIRAAVPIDVTFKRIVCPVDFSDNSLQALKYALSLAEEGDGELTILHVLSGDLSQVPDVVVGGDHLRLADFEARREADARRRLQEAVPASAATFCRIETTIVRGKPWSEILRASSERRAELIVLGVRGRGTADLMFFGSTTQHVVRSASCPVLTIRS